MIPVRSAHYLPRLQGVKVPKTCQGFGAGISTRGPYATCAKEDRVEPDATPEHCRARPRGSADFPQPPSAHAMNCGGTG